MVSERCIPHCKSVRLVGMVRFESRFVRLGNSLVRLNRPTDQPTKFPLCSSGNSSDMSGIVCFTKIGDNVVLDIYMHVLTGLLLIDMDRFIHFTSSLVSGSCACPGLALAASGLVGELTTGWNSRKGAPDSAWLAAVSIVGQPGRVILVFQITSYNFIPLVFWFFLSFCL